MPDARRADLEASELATSPVVFGALALVVAAVVVLAGCAMPSPAGAPHLVMQGGASSLAVQEVQAGLVWAMVRVSVSPSSCRVEVPTGGIEVGQAITVALPGPDANCAVSLAYGKWPVWAGEFSGVEA